MVVSLSIYELYRLYTSEYELKKDDYVFDRLLVAKDGNVLPLPIPIDTNGNTISFSSLGISDLEYFHSLAHSIESKTHIPQICKLHYKIATMLIESGLYHTGNDYCDRVVELIKEDFDEYIKKISSIPDKVLGDDLRIVFAWYSSIKDGKKVFKHINGEKKEITIEELKKLALAIEKERIKRGFKFVKDSDNPNSAELKNWLEEQLKKENLLSDIQVTEITVDYLQKISDKELNDLWEWLHKDWKEKFPDQKVNEDYLNANILIQIERFKRGLIDYNYEDKDELDRQARYSWQEYKTPKLEDYISLEDVIEEFRKVGNIQIEGKPFAGYLCGRIVNEGKIPSDHDIDLVLTIKPTPQIISKLKESLPDWISKRLHIFFDKEGGSIGYSIPMYSLSFNMVSKELQIRGYNYDNEKVTFGKYIIGIKPKSGFGKYEFFDLNEMWSKWGKNYIPCIIEEKVDGRRHQAHISKNEVKLFTEDTQRDRSDVFPEIVEELKKLNCENAIIDGEIVGLDLPSNITAKNARSKRELCDIIPREDTAVITASKEIPEQLRKKLVFVVYDIMFLNNEDLTSKPYSERREIYTKLIGNNFKFIDYVRGYEVKSMKDFFKYANIARKLSGSEGIVAKSSKMVYTVKYSGENRSIQMAKLKNLKEIDVIVLKVLQKETKEGKELPNYIYECGISFPDSMRSRLSTNKIRTLNGKEYLYIGNSYSTSVKCKVGDIITVMPIRIRKYEDKDNKIYYTWMFPFFKEVKQSKSEPDSITTADRIAEVGTAPLSNEFIDINLPLCPYSKNPNICILMHRFKEERYKLSIIRKEVLNYPVNCKLAKFFKCKYLKGYYYSLKEIDELCDYDGDELVDYLSLPYTLKRIALQKYMEMPKGEHDFVMESHILTSEYVPKEKRIPKKGSQHIDFRFKVDGYLNGWSIVGGSVDDMVTPTKMIDMKGKGFRAEEKNQQPLDWLFQNMKAVGKKVDSLKPNDYVDEMFDVIVGEGEPRGKMFVITRGKLIFGTQKPFFHEYFVKDGEFFKDWTRIVVRAVNVSKIDQETKLPTKHKELMWRIMIPEDQTPYAISDRAMRKNWKPPKSNPNPFPVEWVKSNFKEQFNKWLEWKGSNELSDKVEYCYSMHSYKGPTHVRGLEVRTYYFMIKDGNSVRMFMVEDNLTINNITTAVDFGKIHSKYFNWSGKTKPDSFFNPTKSTVGNMKVLATGTATIKTKDSETEDFVISIDSGILKGNWEFIQEEKGSDIFGISKVESLESRKFVYHKHITSNGEHFDIRINMGDYLLEFNVYGDLRNISTNTAVSARKKICNDISWFKINKPTRKIVGSESTIVIPIDSGNVEVYEVNEDFVSFSLKGNEVSGFFTCKKVENGWELRKEKRPRSLSEFLSSGDPNDKAFDDFEIEDKKTWEYFKVYLFDFRKFTKTEPIGKYIDKELPNGVDGVIGLYPRLGKINGARVAYLLFNKNNWTYDKAIDWIKKSKLHLWIGEQKTS